MLFHFDFLQVVDRFTVDRRLNRVNCLVPPSILDVARAATVIQVRLRKHNGSYADPARRERPYQCRGTLESREALGVRRLAPGQRRRPRLFTCEYSGAGSTACSWELVPAS